VPYVPKKEFEGASRHPIGGFLVFLKNIEVGVSVIRAHVISEVLISQFL
jgi:hypothetical protein